MPLINRKALDNCFSGVVIRRSAIVAVIVGSILVAINQGDAILSGSGFNWYKAALTYVVPFLVASYGAYAALSAAQVQDTSR
ncbi:MAG: nitrate/nitrite transporter NrtS [Erythrobacter sp.]